MAMTSTEFQASAREFVAEAITQNIPQWEQEGTYPLDLHNRAADWKLLQLGHDDYEQMLADAERQAFWLAELTRAGSQAMAMGLASHMVSLTALRHGNQQVFEEVAEQVVSGEKLIVMALTEPGAGSDLRAISSKVEQHCDGSLHFSGEKKFICNGSRADFFITAAYYQNELSLFLVEREPETTCSDDLHCIGWYGLPVSSITFTNARAALIGEVGEAANILRKALAKERLNLAVMSNASTRSILEYAGKYSTERMVQGKPLYKKQAILHKIATMSTQLKVSEAYVEKCFQALKERELTDEETCIAKNFAVAALEEAANQCVHICGAAGCLQHTLVERTYRDAKILSLGGGSTEIMNEIIGRGLLRPFIKMKD